MFERHVEPLLVVAGLKITAVHHRLEVHRVEVRDFHRVALLLQHIHAASRNAALNEWGSG